MFICIEGKKAVSIYNNVYLYIAINLLKSNVYMNIVALSKYVSPISFGTLLKIDQILTHGNYVSSQIWWFDSGPNTFLTDKLLTLAI